MAKGTLPYTILLMSLAMAVDGLATSKTAEQETQPLPPQNQLPTAQEETAPNKPMGDIAKTEDDTPGSPEATPSQAAFDTLKKEVDELRAWREEQEMAAFEEFDTSSDDFQRVLEVYGFFDIGISRNFVPDGDMTNNMLGETATFSSTHLNLYLKSQMTENLGALVELRFSFLPQGQETFIPFSRKDTSVQDPVTLEQYTQGGVGIERLQVTWQRWDFFGVTVGRFLTPFGIWNIDHGSTVIIPKMPPYILLSNPVPLSQMGMQVHGRFYPARNNYLDYAITLSNSRGPMEDVFDLSDNKALGLRLRWSYEGEDVEVAFGGYGYLGETTNNNKVQLMRYSRLGYAYEDTEKFTEYTGTLDFIIKVYGVHFQAEYARGLEKYDVHPKRMAPVANMSMPDGSHVPDHIKQVGYVLLAWTLPLEKFIGHAKITPYFVGEFSDADDSWDTVKSFMVRCGINFRPNSFLVLKAEYSNMRSPDSDLVSKIDTVGAQVAVAF